MYYSARARGWEKQRLYDKAIDDYTQAIRLEPRDDVLHSLRGFALIKSGEIERSIDDFGTAIRLAPDKPNHYLSRGLIFADKKQFDRAVADFTEATRRGPNDQSAHRRLAWLLATCPDSRIRDGKRAMTEATRACELTNWKNAHCLEALAAAAAETGDFAFAIKWQSQALALSPDKSDESMWCRIRLSLYEIKQPYRD
jgi:tetratricopeptide (TPR) repeat protein